MSKSLHLVDKSTQLEQLCKEAMDKGAYKAKVFSAREIVVDDRVRMKCEIPLCPHYGHCLTCPPNIMSVDEFRKVLATYDNALLVQTRSSITGELADADKEKVLKFIAAPGASNKKIKESEEVYTDLDNMKLAAIRLHLLVNDVEAMSMSMGFHYTTGFIGGDCMLCRECVDVNSGEKCRFPYQARPSMEGVGVDVFKTCINAGLPFKMPPENEIIWSGLILVD